MANEFTESSWTYKCKNHIATTRANSIAENLHNILQCFRKFLCFVILFKDLANSVKSLFRCFYFVYFICLPSIIRLSVCSSTIQMIIWQAKETEAIVCAVRIVFRTSLVIVIDRPETYAEKSMGGGGGGDFCMTVIYGFSLPLDIA